MVVVEVGIEPTVTRLSGEARTGWTLYCVGGGGVNRTLPAGFGVPLANPWNMRPQKMEEEDVLETYPVRRDHSLSKRGWDLPSSSSKVDVDVVPHGSAWLLTCTAETRIRETEGPC